jgi:hypothetical protein
LAYGIYALGTYGNILKYFGFYMVRMAKKTEFLHFFIWCGIINNDNSSLTAHPFFFTVRSPSILFLLMLLATGYLNTVAADGLKKGEKQNGTFTFRTSNM